MKMHLGGLLAAAALMGGAVAVPTPTEARPSAPALFFVPHQDDDVLMYGPDLRNHVLAGRRTVAVLLTDGSGAGLCRVRYGTDSAACTAERDGEFRDAMRALGVVPVIRADRARDGQLTRRYVLRVMREYLARYPGASFKAPTPRDTHRDHAAIGQALRDLRRTADKRFYIKPTLWARYPRVGQWARRRNINTALDAYRAFGALTVPGQFDEQYGGLRASRDPLRFNVGGADAKHHR